MPTRPLVTRYEDDLKLFPDRWHKLGLAVAIPLLLIFPVVFNDLWVTIANHTAIAVVGSLGLMILTGFCGQISMGHAAFLALGAYVTAGLGSHMGLPFWLALPASGLAAAAVGLAVGPFALKLRGLYLAIVTVGLVFLVQHTLLHTPGWTGGAGGIEVPALLGFGEGATALDSYTPREPLDLGFVALEFNQLLYYIFVLLAVACAWMTKNIHRSTTGRAMMAVRDQDLAAAVLGVRPARTKVIAFGISSFFAGLAGGMYALEQTYLTVENFNLHMSIEYIAMIVLGGIGTLFGAIAGAIGYVAIEPLTELIGGFIPFMNEWSNKQQSSVLFALVVVGFLVFEPLGLFGVWLRVKRYFMGWPFRY